MGTGSGGGSLSSCWRSFSRSRKLFNTSIGLQTREYFDKSTLHGVRYIAEDSRPFYEK